MAEGTSSRRRVETGREVKSERVREAAVPENLEGPLPGGCRWRCLTLGCWPVRRPARVLKGKGGTRHSDVKAAELVLHRLTRRRRSCLRVGFVRAMVVVAQTSFWVLYVLLDGFWRTKIEETSRYSVDNGVIIFVAWSGR